MWPKKHLFAVLLAVTIFVVCIEIILHIYYGYYASGNILLILSMGIMVALRYILILVCLAVTIWSIIKHHHKVFFTIVWISIAILGQIPKGHFETIGALLSLQNPSQVRTDARILMDQYEPMTCIGYRPERYPCDKPIPHDKLPQSIQRIHIGDVLILDDYILLEKFGLQDTFRGFVIFRDGSDPWASEKSIARQNWCSTCWRIRIIDRFYWYHANPSGPPIFTFSLK